MFENENFEDTINRLLSKFTTKKIDFYKLVEMSFHSINNEEIIADFYVLLEEKYFDKENVSRVDQNLKSIINKEYFIIGSALNQIKKDISHESVLFHILSSVFTMPELQSVCEIITGKPMIRGNFYRKMMSLEILDKMGIRKTGQAYKSPVLYRFNKKYFDLVKEGGFIF
ncbi:NrtR DNA-binding winged helix domain-containing protein [Chryseobacterium sp. JUb7]|uniref:NrtR DNA-binding winged helix domain-containing protein n=1 Tax=Chryseobacterium sp. JUb7 TaxID=2940599 RepID=UPI0021672A1C|nr:hypothetical protein [Chryseobacterium sp. JUb7]MCS3528911.1 hypothetical protein [Chryseobacterium sp. JUb7]